MAASKHVLAVTYRTLTHAQDPSLAEGETRIEPIFQVPITIDKAHDEPKSPLDTATPNGNERARVWRDKVTGEIFEDDEVIHGMRFGDGFREIPEDLLADAKRGKQVLIVSAGTIPLDELDFTRSEAEYYVAPEVGAATAYKLVSESLREVRKGKKIVTPARAIVAKRQPSTTEKLGAFWYDEGRQVLMFTQFRMANVAREVPMAALAPQDVEAPALMLAKTREVIDTLPDGREFFDTAVDENRERVEALLDDLVNHVVIEAPEPVKLTPRHNDIEAALAESLATVEGA